MINEEVARKTLNMEVRTGKVTGKILLNLLKKLMKEADKLGGLEKLVNTNGNEVKLKDLVKKGQLEEIPVQEVDLKELKKELNKDGVMFSVMKDKSTGNHSVFFQAKDIKVMDTDDTFNFVVSIMYSQLFNLLCDKADDVYGGRLPIHVRCLLDEFANIGLIPKFEKLIATIRSREISASIILQAQSQLKAIYKDNADKGKDYTITRFDDMGNNLKTVTVKDNTEYLGGMITGSDVIPYRKESELDRIFENLTNEKPEKTFEEIGIKKNEVHNFKITEETLPAKLSPSERLNNNLEAISMLNRVESGERELDITAQEILAKYVGWGGLSDVFDESKDGQWKEARAFLKDNLSQAEYEAARESTLTSFYTPKAVIDGIYKTLSGMGFKQGNILEPSMGIGNFIGNLPDEMSKSKFYGVELDSVSGRIGKFLYPESEVQVKGLEETGFSNNFFDVAIGNVPFGEYKVNDREYNRNNFLIHDYFFAKSIDKVRNGGVIAFITSLGTMDKKDESVRRYLAARAEFLGAIRLPNDTFKGVAGTEVTSDIIFLKKRDT